MSALTPLTWAHGSIVAAALLPIICAGIAKGGQMGKSRREGGYDNHNPRVWMEQQTGYRARANAAQENSFEVLPLFIAAVLVAHQTGAPQNWLNGLAWAFIAVRVAYIYCYISDRASLRSLVWAIGWVVTLMIFFLSAWR